MIDKQVEIVFLVVCLSFAVEKFALPIPDITSGRLKTQRIVKRTLGLIESSLA